MRLLFAIKTMDSRGGGAERVLTQTTGELARRGHDVTLVSFDAPDSPDFYAVDRRVHRLWLNAGRRHSRTGAMDVIKRSSALRRTVRQLRPDVAIGFMHSAFVPLGLALARTGIPVIGSEHIVQGHYATRPLERLALFASASLYDAITVVSEQAKADFPGPLVRRMTVIPNPVVPERGTEQIERRDLILSVGRLAEQKDHRTLIAAFATIASRRPGWVLRIVGDGELRGELERQALQLGIADRVELPGPTPDIWAEYAAARIFVIPSSYESFGLATAEALAAGLPAIGFADCAGTNELIQHGVNGLLVDPADRVRNLGSAIDRLIEAPSERSRLATAARASSKGLAVEDVADRWEQLFEKVRRNRFQPPIG